MTSHQQKYISLKGNSLTQTKMTDFKFEGQTAR